VTFVGLKTIFQMSQSVNHIIMQNATIRSLKISPLLVALNTGAWIIPQETSAQHASVAIRENDQPGHHLNNSELQIYRPQVQKRRGSGENPVPSKVMRLDDLRPAPERNAGNRQRDVRPINNSHKDQQSESRDVNSSNIRGKEQQPQNVAPPDKNLKARLSQPKTNQDETEAGTIKKKASTMFTRAIQTIYFNKLFNQSKR
jgi:hypothetical protein